MCCRLVIDGNAVYEIDEECLKKRQGRTSDRNTGNINRQNRQGKNKERNS